MWPKKIGGICDRGWGGELRKGDGWWTKLRKMSTFWATDSVNWQGEGPSSLVCVWWGAWMRTRGGVSKKGSLGNCWSMVRRLEGLFFFLCSSPSFPPSLWLAFFLLPPDRNIFRLDRLPKNWVLRQAWGSAFFNLKDEIRFGSFWSGSDSSSEALNYCCSRCPSLWDGCWLLRVGARSLTRTCAPERSSFLGV